MENEIEVLPEMKQIIGALLFAAKDPLSISQIKKAIISTGDILKGPYKQYVQVDEIQIKHALDVLENDLKKLNFGLELKKIAGGYRFQNNMLCGPFVRSLLDKNKKVKLSKPQLETLAIIAYRQPCLRSEIEEVRGVSVDNLLRKLMEIQLIRVVSRSKLPGKPWLFGTTQKFLEYFGINSVDELPGSNELKKTEVKKEIVQKDSSILSED